MFADLIMISMGFTVNPSVFMEFFAGCSLYFEDKLSQFHGMFMDLSGYLMPLNRSA